MIAQIVAELGWFGSRGANRFNALAPDLPFLRWGIFPPEEGVGTMGHSWGQRLAAAVATALLAGGMAAAQQPTAEDGKRKAKVKVNPQYSELARKMNISGKVRVEIVIALDGHVKSSRAIGGHPLLVQPCLDALRDWKFEPGPEETTEIISFEFKSE